MNIRCSACPNASTIPSSYPCSSPPPTKQPCTFLCLLAYQIVPVSWAQFQRPSKCFYFSIYLQLIQNFHFSTFNELQHHHFLWQFCGTPKAPFIFHIFYFQFRILRNSLTCCIVSIIFPNSTIFYAYAYAPEISLLNISLRDKTSCNNSKTQLED